MKALPIIQEQEAFLPSVDPTGHGGGQTGRDGEEGAEDGLVEAVEAAETAEAS